MNIIKRSEWLKLREIRNRISHEYPYEINEIIDNLNLMIENIDKFENIISKIKEKLATIK